MALLPLVLGVAGNITAFLGLVSPMPTFWCIIKRGSTGSFSSQPYLFSLMSGLFWTYYGLLKHGGIFVVTVSATSCAFQLAYLSVYLWFASLPQRKKTLSILLAILVSYAGMIASTLLLERGSQPIITVGILCILTSAFSTAAPLAVINKVVKTGSVEYMPLALSLGLFLNGTCWLAYSVALRDMFLTIPNAIGVSFSAIQLMLYTFYRVRGEGTRCKAEHASLDALESGSKQISCVTLKEVEAMAKAASKPLPPTSCKNMEITLVTLT